MKLEVTSRTGISFTVELTDEERENIKDDLEANSTEIKSATGSKETDSLLREIEDLL